MIHKPIQLKSLSFTLPHKICFQNFTTSILYGQRIGLIGRNGCGKSSLLKLIVGINVLSEGHIHLPNDVTIGYVPQISDITSPKSGGEKFQIALTKALQESPNLLLLDEPTNHLDRRNREGLLRLLNSFPGTLIVASHDPSLLRQTVDTLWHIGNNGQIHVFKGHYDDYRQELAQQQITLTKALNRLSQEKEEIHHSLMKEQVRASKSRQMGEKNIDRRKWPTIVSKTKVLRSQKTSGHKKLALKQNKQTLTNQLRDLRERAPESIKPKFSLIPERRTNPNLVTIRDGDIGYTHSIIHHINLTITYKDRIALQGDNGSGKSTVFKALRQDFQGIRRGEWTLPKIHEIGYLDQHYDTLNSNLTVYETIRQAAPHWSYAETRDHLNSFLFRKNEEVETKVCQLSGGEKARLSLAQVAACPPKLLLLDEITNNLDLETREHIIQVLQNYPGAFLIISHNRDFLDQIGITHAYKIQKNGNFG